MTITKHSKCTSESRVYSPILLSLHFVITRLTRENRYSPSQADVSTHKALKSAPDTTKYPHAARWYKHITSWTDEFATLPGDAAKEYSTYGPEVTTATLNPAKAPAAEEDDDEVDLFGSDDEEEDAEAARIRDERLAEYKKKKEGKTKPAAKSVVTLDVKPWGMSMYKALVRVLITDYETR
jgi:elongation factor 1-beta